MKPTKRNLEAAVAQLTILRFFPAEPIARAVIMDLLARLVGTNEQLNWLVRAMVDRVGEWHGPKELRGLFCSRYRPADGIEADCSISGFTAADSEQAAIAAPAPRAYLPAPDDSPITAEERASIDALQRKVSLRAALERSQSKPESRQRSKPPKWLENLA